MSTLATLLLLVLLHSGDVAVATNQQGLSCRQEIPVGLIRDLWSKSRQLINKLPREKNSDMKSQLLPRFCTTCGSRSIGWPEVRQLLDVYQSSVFSDASLQELFPLHFGEMLHELQLTLNECVPLNCPTKWSGKMKRLEKKIKKKKNKAIKAASEFTLVVRWINELMQRPLP